MQIRILFFFLMSRINIIMGISRILISVFSKYVFRLFFIHSSKNINSSFNFFAFKPVIFFFFLHGWYQLFWSLWNFFCLTPGCCFCRSTMFRPKFPDLENRVLFMKVLRTGHLNFPLIRQYTWPVFMTTEMTDWPLDNFGSITWFFVFVPGYWI